MRIVEIQAQSNGAHCNQLLKNTAFLPGGWAVIPETIETPNFPFGDIEAQEINGVMTVTKWMPIDIPEPEPVPDPEPTADELMDILLGVENDG